VLAAALLLAGGAQGQKLTMSVTDLSAGSGISPDEGKQLTRKLLNELAAARVFDVVDIGKRDQILKEQEFQMTGACDQASCLVEVGQLLGVQKMIGGSIGKVGQAYSVELQMLDVRTSRLDMPFSRQYTGDISALLGAMKEAALEFSKWKPGPTAQPIAEAKAEYGSLRVQSTPPGARIYLDGNDVGTTPGMLGKLEIGEYNIVIVKDGYSSFSQTVRVSRNVTGSVNAALTKEYGTLTVTSVPTNAAVYIDGVPKGTVSGSGLRVSGLGIGVHKIRVAKTGYAPYEVEMTLESGEGNTLNAVLNAKPGSMVITSTPGGAGVTVDGTPRGNTPCSVTGLEPGTYSVKVEKTGYEDGEISVSVEAGQSVTRTVVLRKTLTPSVPPSPGGRGSGLGLTYLSTNAQGYKEYRNEKDGSVLIEIPAGSFTMGSNDGGSDEKPVHTVSLNKYYIGKYEVTNAQYKKFCDATGHAQPSQPSDPGFSGLSNYFTNYPNYPVVNVSWNDAKAYCDWAGLRLPTEAEWEKAARGTDGRKYLWGNTWDAAKCNSSERGDSYEYTSPVGSFPSGVSPYGCYDMAGNVWEWCNDWYGENYYANSPSSNPAGPASGDDRVLRGGGWNDDAGRCRSANRGSNFPEIPDVFYFGFRVAQ